MVKKNIPISFKTELTECSERTEMDYYYYFYPKNLSLQNI